VTTWNDPPGGFHPVSAPDYLPREQLQAIQLQRLQSVASRAFEHVALFRSRAEQRRLKPTDIKALSDIVRLRFTFKADLRDTYPFGLFASPMEQVIRLHASSGTTGKPIVVAYTQSDVNVWTEAMVRTLVACGVHSGDVVQNAYGYGLFTGGLGIHYGAEALGATVIPISGGNTERQLMVMQDFGVTVVCCTPSYFLHLLEAAKEIEVDLSRVRVGVFGAEPWSEAMRDRIQADCGIKAHDVYGLSEITGPGVGSECSAQDGLHVFEDRFYPEIVQPETGDPLPDGEEGELVLTTLSKQAMPMIRYRTRDLTSLITEPCGCGRTLRRIKRISRRADDMLVIRGVNVFPSQVETALLRVEGTLPHYQIVLTRDKGLDQMEVKVEVTPEVFSDEVRRLEALQHQLEASLESALGLRAEVALVEPRTIARSEGRANRILDQRGV
jgi:phenylacetate-CoA ligase